MGRGFSPAAGSAQPPGSGEKEVVHADLRACEGVVRAHLSGRPIIGEGFAIAAQGQQRAPEVDGRGIGLGALTQGLAKVLLGLSQLSFPIRSAQKIPGDHELRGNLDCLFQVRGGSFRVVFRKLAARLAQFTPGLRRDAQLLGGNKRAPQQHALAPLLGAAEGHKDVDTALLISEAARDFDGAARLSPIGMEKRDGIGPRRELLESKPALVIADGAVGERNLVGSQEDECSQGRKICPLNLKAPSLALAAAPSSRMSQLACSQSRATVGIVALRRRAGCRAPIPDFSPLSQPRAKGPVAMHRPA